MSVATIGLDIAKQVFQIHGADKMGRRVLRRKLRRSEVPRFFSEHPLNDVLDLRSCRLWSVDEYDSHSMIFIGHDFFLLDGIRSQFDTFRVSLRGHRIASGIREHPSSERAYFSAGTDFAS